MKKKSKSAPMPYFQIRSKLGDSVVKREIDLANFEFVSGRAVAQRAKFTKKVHKPPLRIKFINFELNGYNASIWVP